MKGKPEIDWAAVATDAGFKNAETAKVSCPHSSSSCLNHLSNPSCDTSSRVEIILPKVHTSPSDFLSDDPMLTFPLPRSATDKSSASWAWTTGMPASPRTRTRTPAIMAPPRLLPPPALRRPQQPRPPAAPVPASRSAAAPESAAPTPTRAPARPSHRPSSRWRRTSTKPSPSTTTTRTC
jgi:hypothetical protein